MAALGEPEVAVGTRRDIVGTVTTGRGGQYELMAWLVGLIIPIAFGPSLGEPEVAVGARRDPIGAGVGSGEGELADGVSGGVDHPDRVCAGIDEPDVAVGTSRDPFVARTRTATTRKWEFGDR